MLNVLKSERKKDQSGGDIVTVTVEDTHFPEPFHPVQEYLVTYAVSEPEMPGEAVAFRVLSAVRSDTLQRVDPSSELFNLSTRAAANLVCEDLVEQW